MDQYACAGYYALRQQPDEVFACLEKRLATREPGPRGLVFDREFILPGDDPRWEPLWQKAGFPSG